MFMVFVHFSIENTPFLGPTPAFQASRKVSRSEEKGLSFTSGQQDRKERAVSTSQPLKMTIIYRTLDVYLY